MKYLIFGNGWIGNMLKDYLGSADLYAGRIENFDPVSLPEWKEYDTIINTAAKTNIDWCEKNKLETLKSNVLAAARLAELSGNNFYNSPPKKYVFLSTACMFESKGINDIKYEDDIPNPQCFYAETKVLAEKIIQEIVPDALILRPRLPISEIPHPRNTLNKLLNYQFISNAQESIDVVEDMFPVIKELMEKRESGVFHLANAGTISPAEIAGLLGHTFKEISKKELDERLKKEGRAKRVTTYVGSKRISLLPDIRVRIHSVIKKYGDHGG